MTALVECVPNFSEGRRTEVVEAIVASAASVPDAAVLDWSMDADHNRAVVTLVAPPAAIVEAAVRAVAEAVRRIDLNAHAGAHPRMGAADVVPFVPLGGAPLEACVALAREAGARVADELAVPVLFYGDAATRPERRLLPAVRRPFEALRDGRGAPLDPDLGPPRPHPTAGATAVGVRPFLIAFNVDLETDDVAVARAVARAVRERDGGLPAVRALGLALPGRGRAQVSMNLVDHRRTGLVAAFEAVEREARARGVAVRGSELVGLAPRDALDAEVARRVRLAGFDPARHVLEERVLGRAAT